MLSSARFPSAARARQRVVAYLGEVDFPPSSRSSGGAFRRRSRLTLHGDVRLRGRSEVLRDDHALWDQSDKAQRDDQATGDFIHVRHTSMTVNVDHFRVADKADGSRARH